MNAAVDIIVLNWNGAADTVRCVNKLIQQTFPYRSILVIDNGSVDDSPRALKHLEDHDRVNLLLLPTNLGFVGGCNFAMQKSFNSGADYVWLFNNDAIPEPDALVQLVMAAELDSRIGLLSPLILEAEDHSLVQMGCGLLDLSQPGYQLTYDVGQAQAWQRDFPDRIVLHGTALLVRRSLYQAIGGFDDRFFAYWEDIDYSIRSSQAGYQNLSLLDTYVYHGSKDTRNTPDLIKPHYFYFYTRNEILTWSKYCKGRRYLRILLWVLVRQLKQIARMPGNVPGIDAITAGLWHGWFGIGGRFDPKSRMPNPLRFLLRRFPGVWLEVLGEAKPRLT